MLQLVANITKNDEAQLLVKEVDNPIDTDLKPDEVVVKIEAAPVNPSDLGLLVPPGNLQNAKNTETELIYPLDKQVVKIFAPRVDKPSPTGNEGAGVVVKAGTSPAAQQLMNKVVAIAGARGMYSQFMKVSISKLLPHLDGTTSEEAASSFVNPVTALCIVDNVKTSGHKAFIHTAAASQLGVMLVKLCQKEKLPIVNVVRKESQEKTLRDLGATFVVRSDKPTFMQDLIAACAETKATCAFDAIGGGDMASNLLIAMEEAVKTYTETDPASFYGTDVFKQVYIYGGLNRNPTVLTRGFGFSWGINAWLMPRYMATLKKERIKEIFASVALNIKTIFKTEYYKKVSLKELIQIENFAEMAKQATGKKFLVLPQN